MIGLPFPEQGKAAVLSGLGGLLLATTLASSLTVSAEAPDLPAVPDLPKAYRATNQEFVLVDFFSPWCYACKQMKPYADQLDAKLGKQLKVTYVDITQEKNAAIAREFKVASTPTFILFSPKGKAVYQMRDKLYPRTLQAEVTDWVVDGCKQKAC